MVKKLRNIKQMIRDNYWSDFDLKKYISAKHKGYGVINLDAEKSLVPLKVGNPTFNILQTDNSSAKLYPGIESNSSMEMS